MEQFLNEGLRFVFASLLTPENVLFFLGAYVFLVTIYLTMAKWYWGVREQTELLKQIEANTRIRK